MAEDRWKVLAVIHDGVTACEEYRVIQPLQELEKSGHEVWIMTASTLKSRLKRGVDDFAKVDLMLVNRIISYAGQQEDYAATVVGLKGQGTACICDFDDDFTNQFRAVHPGILPDLKQFDAVTVTTEELKHCYGGMNKHIYILPNLIQLGRWATPEREIPHPTIGLTGSETHRKDWIPAAKAILRVLNEHSEWRAFVSGYMPPELAGHPQVLTPGMVRKEYTVTDLKVPYPHYPWLTKQIDIMVCPVDPGDRFNWHKSPLKMLEGWAAGCAVIATGKPLPIYANHANDATLLTEHSEESYYQAITHLVENKEARDKLVAKGKEEIWNYDAEARAAERELVYRTVIGRRRRKMPPLRKHEIREVPEGNSVRFVTRRWTPDAR